MLWDYFKFNDIFVNYNDVESRCVYYEYFTTKQSGLYHVLGKVSNPLFVKSCVVEQFYLIPVTDNSSFMCDRRIHGTKMNLLLVTIARLTVLPLGRAEQIYSSSFQLKIYFLFITFIYFFTIILH